MKRFLPRLCIGVTFFTCGLLWLIGGLTAFNFDYESFFAGILLGFAIAFAIGSFVFRSKGYFFFVGAIGTLSAMLFLDKYATIEQLRFPSLWVMILAAPGVGCFIMMFIRKFSGMHIKLALLFLGSAALLYVGILGYVSWYVLVPSIVVLVGLIIIINAVFRRGNAWDIDAEHCELEDDSAEVHVED